MRIESFSEDYQEQVIELILGIQTGEFGIPITAEKQPDLKDISGYYQTGAGNFWVAVDAGRVVGTVSLLDIGGRQASLRKMFVHKKYRGRKAKTAEKLLAGLMNWAEAKGIKEIFLGTTPMFLAAHRFYEKNGFAQIPKSDLPQAFPVMEVDTKFYRYTL